jgi:hypothetical protein
MQLKRRLVVFRFTHKSPPFTCYFLLNQRLLTPLNL